MNARLRRFVIASGVLFPLLVLLAVAAALLLQAQGGTAVLRTPRDALLVAPTDAQTVARGEYLAHLGNCITCHTARGGTPYAGGRAFPSPYGTLYSTNITPDPDTGLGHVSLEQFRHAMRHGVGRDGLLYPVFPFANFNRLDDRDLDALYAWSRRLAPVRAVPPPNALEFPASSRRALLAWRMLFHRPQSFEPEPAQSDAWNRGRYLVEGIGHCAMCHGDRGSMASLRTGRDLAGERIIGRNWHAPALDRDALHRYTVEELAASLQHGVSPHGSAYGAMAEVIAASLRHLHDDDALAMATFLKSVPVAADGRRDTARATREANSARRQQVGEGRQLYLDHCADCHQPDGRGRGLDYPPLAGNPLVVSDDAVNPIRLVLSGGIAPTTAGNPQPYSMPPFAQKLDDAEIAAVLNYIRASWGNDGTAVSPAEVGSLRGSTLD